MSKHCLTLVTMKIIADAREKEYHSLICLVRTVNSIFHKLRRLSRSSLPYEDEVQPFITLIINPRTLIPYLYSHKRIT